MQLFLMCSDKRFEEFAKETGSREINVDTTKCTTLYKLIKEVCQQFMPLDEIDRYLENAHESENRICFSMMDHDFEPIGPNVVFGKIATTELEKVGAGQTGIKANRTYSEIADIRLDNLIERAARVSIGFYPPNTDSYPTNWVVNFGNDWWDYSDISEEYISLRPSDETDISPSEDFCATEGFTNEVLDFIYSTGEIEKFRANMKLLTERVEAGFCDISWLVCENEENRIDLKIYPDTVLFRAHEDVASVDDEDDDDF